ncbi:MAG: VOC family protein [Pyrinomonadaceae bacterium]
MKKLTFFTILFTFSGLLRAQDVGSFAINFDHFALSVRDVDRSAEFYKNILKLPEITNRTKMAGIRWISLGEGKELHLISILPGQVTITKAVHLGLKTSNFNEVRKRLDDAMITYSDWPGAINTVTERADGVKQMYFQDPDGYWIEVNNVGESEPPPGSPSPSDKTDVLRTIRQFVDGFNKGDNVSAVAACARETAIIDEFPPYEWHGDGSCTAWMNDYAADAQKNSITDGLVTLGKPRHIDVSGYRAYVVIPSNYTFKKQGKPIKEVGSAFTFALRKAVSGWLITGWSWSKN